MLKFNNIVLKHVDKWLFPIETIDWNPYGLPPYTLRVELFPDEVEPLINYDFRNDKLTMTQVSASPNIWDIKYTDSIWDSMFELGGPGSNVKGVIGGNLTGVTSIIEWFYVDHTLEYVNIIDTPDVTNMAQSFYGCDALVNIPKYFNLASVEDMYRSFGYCYSLVHAPKFVNSSNLRNLSGIFTVCPSLTDIPLFDTSNVVNFNDMFAYCPSLKEVPNLNTSSAESMFEMFYCTAIEVAPVLDTSNVVEMGYMFEGCTGLKEVPLYNTQAVTGMEGTFEGCNSIETVPVFDTSNVSCFTYMFDGCTSLKEVPLFDVSSAAKCAYMFNDTVNVERGSLALYNRLQALGSQITSKTDCFKDCGSNTTTGAAELAQIPSSWK